MPTLIITAAAFLLASPFLLAQSSALDAVKAEPMLDKRAAKAVDAASQSVTDARKFMSNPSSRALSPRSPR